MSVLYKGVLLESRELGLTEKTIKNKQIRNNDFSKKSASSRVFLTFHHYRQFAYSCLSISRRTFLMLSDPMRLSDGNKAMSFKIT